MTPDQLTTLCAVWQGRLRLRDWDVTAHLVPLTDIRRYGNIEWQLHHKSARITITDSADMATHDPLYDQERTLVHELLRLHFLAWDTEDGTLADTALEQALTAVVRALVNHK